MEQVIKNRRDADRMVRQLLNIGETMYDAGTEISLIESSLCKLGKSYGAVFVQVYAITSSIVVTVEFADDLTITQSRRIKKRDSIDCRKMESLYLLCQKCSATPMQLAALKDNLTTIAKQRPADLQIYIGQIIAASSFAIFFGGSLKDAFAAALGAIVICTIQRWIKPFFSSQLFFFLTISFLTGICINLFNLVVPDLHVNQILIGDIMVLIPGIAITNSIRYILSGDMISSYEKLMDSLLQAFCIAAGFTVSMLLIRGTITDAVTSNDFMRNCIQLLFATSGTFGFCLVFNVPQKHILYPTIGGFICWFTHLFMLSLGCHVFLAALTAAFAVGLYGEIMAKILPVTSRLFFIPSCIPLIPGKNLYYSTLAVIFTDREMFTDNIRLLVLYAVGIALGLAVAAEIEKAKPPASANR